MLTIRILDNAVRELERLDKPTAKRIVSRIKWLAENLDNVKREALAGDLAGLFKFRVGDYRVIYQLLEEEQVMIIHKIGHRSEIYR